MRSKLKQQIWQWRGVAIATLSVAGLVVLAGNFRLFQSWELTILDWFFRLRPTEPPDPRIVLVTIDEADIAEAEQWPLPDGLLAELLKKIAQQQPRVIGLNLYRDLPMNPGHEELVRVFQTMPNLIGIEKYVNDAIPPPPALSDRDRVAIADVVVDADGRVRRGLMAIRPKRGALRLSLAAQLVDRYLAAEGIFPEPVPGREDQLRLGKAILQPFLENHGGYVRADNGGYQLLLNYRGTEEDFHRVSMTDVLRDRLSPNFMRDRLVIIGYTAGSTNERLYTPYSSGFLGSTPEQSSGLVIHANLASQVLSAALDGRPLLRVWSEPMEWLWIGVWSFVGAASSWVTLQAKFLRRRSLPGATILSIAAAACVLVGVDYVLFLHGWWVLCASPLAALIGSAVFVTAYHNHYLQRLASVDGLTQVANRRFFDDYLEALWQQMTQEQRFCGGNRKSTPTLAIILCDVDSFKQYNDTYGHQAGDACLQQVAKIIHQSVRHSDFTARYGGEEFAVLLPNTSAEKAEEVAQRICDRVRSAGIPHIHSAVSPYVTISCGVAIQPVCADTSPTSLIEQADRALYDAKATGRDRIKLR